MRRDRAPGGDFAFDLLALRSKDVRALPLLKRKALLQRELAKAERIVYCQHVGEIRGKLFARPMSLASRALSRGAPIRRIGEAGHRTG